MKLVIVATHPIQYQVPWFRGLAARDDVDLTVLFGMIPDEEQQGVGFGIPFAWDVPLLEGYDYEVLDNAVAAPGLDGFRASSTPGVGDALERLDPDAVVITGWHQLPMLQGLRAAMKLDIPRLVRGESNALRERPWYVRGLHRMLLSRYDAFLAIGRANRAFYRGYGIPDERIFSAPYFIENDRFARQAATEEPRRGELRAGWGIPDDAACFVFLGKLEPKKHPLDLLEAVARVHADPHAPPVHLLVVGTGALMDEMKARAEGGDLPVTFAGFLNQTEITAAYVAADCLVLPSDTGETWGLVVNEAMACGRPAVVSDQVGCAEDLVVPGVTGEIFPCRDVDALAGTLERLAGDREGLEAMGRRARGRVADYSAEAAVEGTLAAARYVLADALDVVHYHRRPVPGHFSVEGYFEQVRSRLPERVRPRVEVCRFVSRGLFRRLYNAVEAAFRQGDVNHVTGDVHYLTFFLRGHRTVLTIHDCEPLERMTGLKRLLLLWLWFRIPVRRAGAVTVNSDATKSELLEHVRADPETIEVVPVSVSDAFQPTPADFDGSRPRILQVGTAHNKNIPRLARALRGVPCTLDVIGRLTDEQKAALRENGIEYEASWDLSQQEIVERYERADMVAFVSTYEGFGMPILEAQAVERPVVTSDVLSMPEVAGDGACLVDPFDVDSIRAGILRVIEDADFREALVAAGRKNRRRYDPGRIADRYADIYDGVVGRAPSPVGREVPA